jgi:magnesium-transporting ATPase (P-type)
MFDPPRDDSKATIEKANEKGVKVKMVTGDDTAIAIETAHQLGMGTKIIPAADVFPKDMDPNHVPSQIIDAIERADGCRVLVVRKRLGVVDDLVVFAPTQKIITVYLAAVIGMISAPRRSRSKWSAHHVIILTRSSQNSARAYARRTAFSSR